jgi:hypothetical protein
MPSMRSQFVYSLAVSLILLSATIWGQTAHTPAPTAGVAPAAETQAPSAKVDITYVNGQLTIKANGEPLIEVLRAACKRIGAELDAQVQPTDPVFGTLGPGIAKEVLGSLLSDAHVNYALGGTATDPNALTNVAILPQTQDSSARTQVAQEQTAQAKDNSAVTAPVKSGAGQMLELIEAAKGELASGVILDNQNDGAESVGGATQVDLAALVQQIEAQLKATDSGTSNTGAPGSNVVNPTHRPEHRKHH